MKLHDPKGLMYEILQLQEEINKVASRLDTEVGGVFGKLSLRMPRLTPAELGFVRAVSWFYVLYYEVGKVNIDFLEERLPAYGLDPSRLSKHIRLVGQLRTFLQHHLDESRPRNRQIQEACEQWLRQQCGTPVPDSDDQWECCLVGFLQEAMELLSLMRSCIRLIEKDESREEIVREWRFRRTRYHSPEEFDSLISVTIADLGRDGIDPVRLRKRFYEKWMEALDQNVGVYIFDVEARKLIEHTLLFETIPVLPITGHDIIDELDIPPGREVRRLLEQARVLYDADPCNRDRLIERLREHIAANG